MKLPLDNLTLMTMDYYKKYLDGNRKQIWTEIVSLNEDNTQEDSIKKACEFLAKNVKYNIGLIYDYLKSSNYVFNNKDILTESYNYSNPNFNSGIKKIKEETEKYGYLPYTFLEIYKYIDGVSFEGFFPEWEDYNYLKKLPSPDPLVLLSSDIILTLWDINEKVNLSENGYYYLPFSPTALTKRNISDDGLYGIFLKEKISWDGNIGNYKRNILFTDYLRNCFRWGGFPGLEFIEGIPKNDNNLLLLEKISKELIPI